MDEVEVSFLPNSQCWDPSRLRHKRSPFPTLYPLPRSTLVCSQVLRLHIHTVIPPTPSPSTELSPDSGLSTQTSHGHLKFNIYEMEANMLPSSPTSHLPLKPPAGASISGPNKTDSRMSIVTHPCVPRSFCVESQ